MLAPGLLLILVFRYIPMLSITVAFKDYSIFKKAIDSPWVGLKHFRTLFSLPEFYSVMANTVIISMYKILFAFPVPIILALCLNEVGNKYFKKIAQNICYLPHFFSWVVIAGLCFDILSVRGVVNSLLGLAGLPQVSFLMEPKWIRLVLVTTDIWKEAGWSSIIYLAALTAIDQELYEAATIDGAGRVSRLWYITLPALIPIIGTMLIIRLSSVLDVGFDQIIMLINARVRNKIEVLDTYVYRIGVAEAKYDFSTAVGLFKSAISALFVVSANHILKKTRGEGLW
jgi:putative aldouronate transport system permease protein